MEDTKKTKRIVVALDNGRGFIAEVPLDFDAVDARVIEEHLKSVVRQRGKA